MSIEALDYINNLVKSLVTNYRFMEWKDDVPEIYWIGEYQEIAGTTKEENGMQETTFILTGTTRGSWLSLETDKQTIENGITQTAILENNSGIAVFYENALVIPTGDATLKRLQINLTIKEWKVNE